MCTCLIVLMRLHNLESLGGENTLSIQKGNWWGGGGGGGGCCECQSGYYSRELIKKIKFQRKSTLACADFLKFALK